MMRARSSTAREKLYDASRARNAAGALEDHPRCNIPGCGAFVRGKRWVESHFPSPRSIGGTATGVAHEACNFRYWCKVEAPIVAKVKRQRQKYIGAWRSRHRLPGGRDDPRKRTMAGKVVERATGKPWTGFKARK